MKTKVYPPIFEVLEDKNTYLLSTLSMIAGTQHQNSFSFFLQPSASCFAQVQWTNVYCDHWLRCFFWALGIQGTSYRRKMFMRTDMRAWIDFGSRLHLRSEWSMDWVLKLRSTMASDGVWTGFFKQTPRKRFHPAKKKIKTFLWGPAARFYAGTLGG